MAGRPIELPPHQLLLFACLFYAAMAGLCLRFVLLNPMSALDIVQTVTLWYLSLTPPSPYKIAHCDIYNWVFCVLFSSILKQKIAFPSKWRSVGNSSHSQQPGEETVFY